MRLGTKVLIANVRKRIDEVGSLRKVAREIGVTPSALSSLFSGRRPQKRNRLKYDAWNKKRFGEHVVFRKPRERDLKELNAAVRKIERVLSARPLDEQNQLYMHAFGKFSGLARKLWR